MRDVPPEQEGGGVPGYISDPGTTKVEPNSPEARAAEDLAETEAQIAALDRLMTAHARLGEQVDAYRTALLGRGYSAPAAEAMTVDYHRYLLNFAVKRASTPR